MPRPKILSREEYRAVVTNLLDLGFTAPAIAYMTGKTDVSVYHLLERIGRKRGRSLVRVEPLAVDPNSTRFVARLFVEPDKAVRCIWRNRARRKVKK